jgi:hypothetical protein
MNSHLWGRQSRPISRVGTPIDEEFTRENGAYLSAAWRFHPKFEGLIGGQWGLSDGDLDGSPVDPTPGERKHHRSINIALRWDVTDHWLIKAEAMWADGTLLITGGEQQDTPNGIQENWSLYTLKTTFDF